MTSMTSKAYVLLMMGGIGSRFGAELPKQFTDVGGGALFTYIARKLAAQDCIDGIVVVVNAKYLDLAKECMAPLAIGKILAVVPGGASRSESVFNGLKALASVAQDEDVVLMHDATHPYVDEAGTAKVVEMVRQYGSATLASLNFDTTYMMDDENNVVKVIPRRNVIAGASPEGFRYRQIYDIYQNTPPEEMEKMTSVGAIALAYDIPMKVVPTDVLNLKITYPRDMELFKMLYKEYFFNEAE